MFEFPFWASAAASKMKTKCNKRLRLKAATKNQRPEISPCADGTEQLAITMI